MNQRIKRLVTLAEGLMTPFIDENKDLLGGRKGLCLAILDLEDEKAEEKILVFDLGLIPPDKLEDKRKFAKEKVQRLRRHHKHLTSFESAYTKVGRYGGGIRVNEKLIVAASGFPAYLDQEFCTFLGLMDYQMNFLRAYEIRRRTINEYPHSFQASF